MLRKRHLQALARDENGFESTEWGVLASLVVLGVVLAITELGSSMSGVLTYLGSLVPA